MPGNPLDGLMAPDLGAQWQNAIMSGMEFARQTKARSALAAYAQNPSMESAAGVIQHDPIMGLNLRRDEEARMAAEQRAQAQQAGAQREQAMKMAQLLDTVTDEQSYQQARQTAEYLNFDLSRVPPNFDPQWVDMQKRIVSSFLEDGDDSLPTLAQELQAVGVDLRTPEGQEAMRRTIEGKYAGTYVDGQGQVRQRPIFNQQKPSPPPEAIEALRKGVGTPEQFDEAFGQGAAARVMGGGASNGTGGFPR
jgi:hypothetical protein